MLADNVNHVSKSLSDKIVRANRLPPLKERKRAEILPFPVSAQTFSFTSLRIIDANHDYDNDADRKRYLASVVRRHKRRLQKVGIAPDRIAADVADLESAFGLVSG